MGWRKTVKLKDLLDKPEVANLGEYDRLPIQWRNEFVERLKQTFEFARFATRMKRCRSVDSFNKIMADIFDVADRDKILID